MGKSLIGYTGVVVTTMGAGLALIVLGRIPLLLWHAAGEASIVRLTQAVVLTSRFWAESCGRMAENAPWPPERVQLLFDRVIIQ